MHYKNNNNEMNSIANHTAAATVTTANISCSSSTDSGVIIIDNDTTYNNHRCKTSTNAAPDNRNEEISAPQSEKLNFNKNIHVINAGGGANDDRRSNSSTISIENNINIARSKRNSSAGSASDNGWRKESASRNCSPTVSIRSTSISIISIDENAIDSSVVDSDSDYEGDAGGVHSNYVVKKLGQQTTYEPDHPELPHIINKGMKVIGQNITPGNGTLAENILLGNGLCPPAIGPSHTPTTPQIGSIALSNSTDVTFGDKHFYEGPVTIQQFLIDSREKWKSSGEDGTDNPAYTVESKGSANDAAAKANGTSSAATGEPYKFIFNRKAVIITIGIITLTILIGILIVTTSSILKPTSHKSKLLGDGDDSRKNIPINSTIDKDNIGGGRILRIVPRDGWLAQPPIKPAVPLALPVSRVIVISTRTDLCTTQAACTYRVRMIQNFNIESAGYDDIIYNFLIGGDGNVYEGRGWDSTGAHLKGFNENSISFAYIGTFRMEELSPKQLNVTKLLLKDGVRKGKLTPNYKIVSANTLDPTLTRTLSEKLYSSFKGWPQWSDDTG